MSVSLFLYDITNEIKRKTKRELNSDLLFILAAIQAQYEKSPHSVNIDYEMIYTLFT